MGGIFKIALGKFHREMLHLAAASLDNTSSEQRTTTGYTFAIPESGFAKVKEILDEALKKIAALNFGETELDTVYHVALSAFPLTKQTKEKSSDDSNKDVS